MEGIRAVGARWLAVPRRQPYYRNIDIGNMGVGGESKTIRIGTKNSQTFTYIAGIS